MDRRGFLKTLGLAGATLACPKGTMAAEPAGGGDPYGVLVDTTRCVGCNTCTYACAEANGLPEPPDPETVKETTPDQWTVIKSYNTSRGEVFVKRQCMHCVVPACASACLTSAMTKTAQGPVVWRERKCMGCRYCMISCPFDGPKFEYNSATPRIRKCVMCADRVRKGGTPACVESCPEGTLQFGKRSELLQIARKRIAESPDRYVSHIFGEREAGGSSWLYLAGVPFDQIGFRNDMGDAAYPTLTTGFLYNVPAVLTLMPPLLLALSKSTRGKEEGKPKGVGEEEEEQT